jgi:sugar transferase (PEP-CTERM system associated)
MLRVFRHYIPKTLLILGAAEALIFLVSMYIGVTLHMAHSGVIGATAGGAFDGPMFPKATVFALVMLGIMMAMGLYQRDLHDGPRPLLIRLGLTFAVGVVAMLGLSKAYPDLFVGGGAFSIALIASFLGIASCRFLCMSRTDSQLRRRVLVLGVGNRAKKILRMRRRSDQHGVSIIGFVDLGVGARLVDAHNVWTIRTSLWELAERHQIDEIVVALDDRRNKLPVNEILECKMRGIEVLDEASFFERQLGKIRLDSLHPSSVIFSDGFTQALLKPGSKRLFDILASLALTVVAAPVMLVTAIAILAESGGKAPIFYTQERVGKNGRIFRVFKFRSMRVDAESNGIAQWACDNDDRVTRVGRIIRKTRIDELPQLLNVLLGDMSFVGPRPERPEFVADLSRDLPYYNLRHHVKPGITGWAQICYSYGASLDDSREKLQYDLYYLKNYSLFLDLTILIQTVQVILWGKGSR